ncbi:hypothetical protein AmDm5_1998 [Acetobacter malorum]|nr:hypothetical protein AmDm5_1998 [Acetobacter malorum]
MLCVAPIPPPTPLGRSGSGRQTLPSRAPPRCPRTLPPARPHAKDEAIRPSAPAPAPGATAQKKPLRATSEPGTPIHAAG